MNFIMLHKIASVLAISPLALSFVTTAPAQAQLQPAPCHQLIFDGAIASIGYQWLAS
jgi:hypothetical protein